jgi:hypothetical protein
MSSKARNAVSVYDGFGALGGFNKFNESAWAFKYISIP